MKLKKIVAPVKLWKRIVAYLIDVIIVNLIIVYPFRDFFGNFENDIIVKEIGPEIFMVFFIISILTILLIIDSLNIIFRKDYQRYLEKISNTEVVDGE